MNVLSGIEGLRKTSAEGVMSIGNFDGVHRGHQHILSVARTLRAPGSHLVVVTFEPHPLTALRPGAAPPRLTTAGMKHRLLELAGVDDLVVLAPNQEVLNLTAEQFWQILRDDARPAHLVEGANFNFGKNRGGTIETLRQWTSESQTQLHVVDEIEAALLDLQIVDISSTMIRWLLGHGRVREAAICLGRPYLLEGEVVAGAKRGRTIGVPTANLKCADQLVPADGVYAGKCSVDGTDYRAAISVGTNPTFGGTSRQVEAHLLGFDGDLYGRTLGVEFIDWVREQRRFSGIEALQSQIARDLKAVEHLADRDASRPVAVVS